MLTSGRLIRFTPSEIERHARIGLDVGQVRTIEQFAREVERWALVMSEVRPDLVLRLDRMLRARLSEAQSKSEATPYVPAVRGTSA